MRKLLAQLGFFMACMSLLPAINNNMNQKEMQYLKQAISEALPQMEGWCSPEKAQAMMDLIFEIKPKICVEIGVFGGASIIPTAIALKYLDQGKIYAIDPWSNQEYTDSCSNPNDVNRKWWESVDMNYIYHYFLGQLRKYNVHNQCIVLKEKSTTAVEKIKETIDILHIDGNHAELVVSKDIELYFPKVKQGGYIWLDDVLWGTTKKPYQDLMAKCDFIKSVDKGNCYLLRKR